MPDPVAITFAVLSTIVASFGLVLLKLSSGKKFREMIFSRTFVIGGLMFILSGVLMILALRLEELSLVFPVTSLTYIWVAALSKIYLNESMNKWKAVSVVLIAIGIVFITLF